MCFMNDILFLKPVVKERIWGGKRLNTEYGYQTPYEHTGECWAISAHPNGDCMITSGRFAGKTLSQVYQSNRELFNDLNSDRFPLLTKILDAHDDLSVQVHPSDTYALKHFNDLGKNECWYILDADADAAIIYGHRASSKKVFKKMVDEDQWDELLIKKYVKKGDFIFVPAGTVHAIGKGLLILETQQSSDTTFRLYDYHRKDDQGNERALHIKESIDVATIPYQEVIIETKVHDSKPHRFTELIHTEYFDVEKWEIRGVLHKPSDHYLLMSVIEGQGFINQNPIKKGDHFIVTANVPQIELSGDLEIIVSK